MSAKDYPDWVYTVKFPDDLRLVSNEEAESLHSIGVPVLGWYCNALVDFDYLQNNCHGLWPASQRDFALARNRGWFLVSAVKVDV